MSRAEEFEKEWKRYCDSKGGGAVTMNVKDTAKHFAQWQKEQMMKDVVDGEVNIWGSHISLPKGLPSEFSKQRVKVIIIKE